MIILKELNTDQTFKIMPRSSTADTMTIQEEGTSNAAVSYAITLGEADSYYHTITKTVTLEEGKFYIIKVFNGSDIVFRGRIFCTNQTIEDYTINNGIYEQHQGTFIITSI